MVCGVFLLGVASVRAEGLRLYQLSAEAQMRGDAVVASVSDSAANWFNPAILTTIDKGDVSVNVDNLFLHSKYTDTTGRSEKSDQVYFPIPSLYTGGRITGTPWAVGMGINTPFGLATEYSDTADFRYLTTGGKVTLVGVNPNVAYEINPALSVGGGVNYYYSSVELNQKYPWFSAVPGSPDGDVKIKGKGDGWGYNAAISYRPTVKSLIGLTYRSAVNVKYDGDNAELTNIPSAAQSAYGLESTYKTGAKTALKFPDMLSFGYALKGQKLIWELGGQWTHWSTFKTVDVQLDNPVPAIQFNDSSSPLYWKNSWSVRTGGEYKVDDTWSVSGGYFFTKSPVRESTYTPLIPDGDHHVFTTGLAYRRQNLTLRLPLGYILQTGTKSINSDRTDALGQANVDGKYTLVGYEVGLGATYVF